MSKQKDIKTRFKMSSIKFMEALKPKINQSGKKRMEGPEKRTSRTSLLLNRLDNNLNGIPSPI